MNLLMFLQTWSDEQMAAEIKNASWGATSHLLVPTLIFVAIVAVVAVVMSLFNMFKNPGALKKALIGFGALALIFVITYFISSDEVYPELVREFGTSKNTFKWVGAGLTTTLVLFVIGIILLVFDMIKGLFKI